MHALLRLCTGRVIATHVDLRSLELRNALGRLLLKVRAERMPALLGLLTERVVTADMFFGFLELGDVLLHLSLVEGADGVRACCILLTNSEMRFRASSSNRGQIV